MNACKAKVGNQAKAPFDSCESIAVILFAYRFYLLTAAVCLFVCRFSLFQAGAARTGTRGEEKKSRRAEENALSVSQAVIQAVSRSASQTVVRNTFARNINM